MSIHIYVFFSCCSVLATKCNMLVVYDSSYVCIYISRYLHTKTYRYLHRNLHVYICLYTYSYLQVYTYTYTYINMYTHEEFFSVWFLFGWFPNEELGARGPLLKNNPIVLKKSDFVFKVVPLPPGWAFGNHRKSPRRGRILSIKVCT